jgi:hypothetical protein
MGYFLGSPGTREPDRKNWGSSVPKNQERTGTIFSVLVLLVSWFPILKFYDEMPLSPIQGVEGPSFLS